LSKQVFKIELKIMSMEREPPNDPSLPFKKKEKGGEGRSQAWWPMECEGKTHFHLFPLSPQQLI
jgi:hypothetical protein